VRLLQREPRNLAVAAAACFCFRADEPRTRTRLGRDLAEWLAEHGLERFSRLFAENEVDLPTLRQLTDSDLRELNLPFGPRKRILHLIAAERAGETAPRPQPRLASERRQLTVLFCDMVGFTRLAYKLDPERLQLVIRAYENACAACVSRYDGYVFTTLGDGVVAFFGYPIAHENEAERAIRAGLEIVEAVGALHAPMAGRLQVRIGVASGVVVVSPGDRNAVGETMNLASRLQAVAKPGSIVVSEQVRRLAGGVFAYEDLGERELTGVATPTRVHRVLGLSDAESRFAAATHGGLTPLVGRQGELEQALDLWRQTQETRTGRVILLSGDGGLGKSRIVGALRDQLAERIEQTLVYQAAPFFANTAFHPIVGWFERRLAWRREDSAQIRLDRLESFLTDRFGFERGDLRLIASMLSLPFPPRYGALLASPKIVRADTIRVLVEMARAQASARPTLFVFEDLHWADPTTREVVERLIERLADIPALVVITTRPHFQPGWRDRPEVLAIALQRLDPSDSRELLARVAGGALPPKELADEIIVRAEGVPLFVEELTKSVLESLSAVAANVSLPATLRDSLMSRLDRVPAAREVAQIGAVIGREFSYELLAGLNLMGEEALAAGLNALTASGLASASGEPPKRLYTFSHALVQDAAYDSLLKSRRRELHAEVARLLAATEPDIATVSPELLAYHYAVAERHRLAAPLWLKAAETAFARFALAETLSHLRAGLAATAKLRPSRQRDLVELNLRSLMGPTLVAQRGWANAEVAEALAPAWSLAQALDHRRSFLPILSALAVHTMSTGALGASLDWCERMLAQGRQGQDDALEIVGHRSAAATRFWMGDYVGARREGDAVHRLYDAQRHAGIAGFTNSDPFTGEGVYRSQFLWMLGLPEQALAANAAAEANARLRGHPFDLAFLLTLGAQLQGYLGDWRGLLARADEAVAIGKQRGISLLGEILAEISRGVAWLHAGRAEDAAVQLDAAIGRLMQTGHGVWVWYLRTLQAQALAQTGRLGEAEALMDESVARMEAGEERAHWAEALRLRGWLAGLQNDDAAAEAYLRRALEVARAQEARAWELRAAADLARRLAGRGEGRELLREVYGRFTEGFETPDLRAARQLLAELEDAPAGRRSVGEAAKANRSRRASRNDSSQTGRR